MSGNGAIPSKFQHLRAGKLRTHQLLTKLRLHEIYAGGIERDGSETTPVKCGHLSTRSQNNQDARPARQNPAVQRLQTGRFSMGRKPLARPAAGLRISAPPESPGRATRIQIGQAAAAQARHRRRAGLAANKPLGVFIEELRHAAQAFA